MKVCTMVDPGRVFSPFGSDIFRGRSPNAGSRKGEGVGFLASFG